MPFYSLTLSSPLLAERCLVCRLPKVTHISVIKGRCLHVPCRPTWGLLVHLVWWWWGGGESGGEEEGVFTSPHTVGWSFQESPANNYSWSWLPAMLPFKSPTATSHYADGWWRGVWHVCVEWGGGGLGVISRCLNGLRIKRVNLFLWSKCFREGRAGRLQLCVSLYLSDCECVGQVWQITWL